MKNSKLIFGVILLLSTAFVVYVKADKPQNTAPTGVMEEKEAGLPVLGPSSHWIGVRVVPVPDVLLPQFNVEGKDNGLVVVEQVIKDGPAAKGDLKRGDVIVRFGERDIHTLLDLVEQVNQAKEAAQTMIVIRGGEKKELSITPAPRPNSAITLPNHPGMSGRLPMHPQQGMRLGPEIWLGNRDPKQMMREMEEYFRQMQGGDDGEQLLILPEDGATTANSAKRLEIFSKTDRDGKTTLHVKQTIKNGDQTEVKTWEAESVDKLPDEIRGEVQALTGQ